MCFGFRTIGPYLVKSHIQSSVAILWLIGNSTNINQKLSSYRIELSSPISYEPVYFQFLSALLVKVLPADDLSVRLLQRRSQRPVQSYFYNKSFQLLQSMLTKRLDGGVCSCEGEGGGGANVGKPCPDWASSSETRPSSTKATTPRRGRAVRHRATTPAFPSLLRIHNNEPWSAPLAIN
jgi:hypothetical protein